MVLSAQIAWSENVEAALTTISGGGDMSPMQGVQSNVEATLNVLADTVLMEQPPIRRRKLEHLVRTFFYFKGLYNIVHVCVPKGALLLHFFFLDHRACPPT